MSIAVHTLVRGTDASTIALLRDGAETERRLAELRALVARPPPDEDPRPSEIGEGLLVGNKHHAANVALLTELGVTAVLNCAPSGIRNLPLDAYHHHGIEYAYTNVARDSHEYPILHGPDGVGSDHLGVARAFYDRVLAAGGKALFFCVAGQNRSATLAVAVQLLRGVPLLRALAACAKARPFVLENVGFQRQLVELDAVQEKLRGTLAHRLHRSAAGAAEAHAPAKRPRVVRGRGGGDNGRRRRLERDACSAEK